MCRIAGIWSDENLETLSRRCEAMRDSLFNGGPDDAGIFLDRSAGLAMGHRRLSIIDLTETGHQPMTAGHYTLCYNGEVYNYKDLRSELECLGVQFKGTSDSEVVLQSFATWRADCVSRFNGMFAFAIWDANLKELYLFRDRIGVKPLYYYSHNGNFSFASELKAIHSGLKGQLEIDHSALGEFFHYGYISAPRSIYKHVYKLEPGHWIRVSSSHDIEKHEYWSFRQYYNVSHSSYAESDLTDQLEEIMIDAFTKRLIADVPVGVFLSGGVDSSLVTAILARHSKTPIKTFTIGFNEKNYDESVWAKKIAEHLGTDHTEKIVTPEHAKKILPLWPEIYDEPFGDISGIPTTIVSQMTREHVKVSLSADGGDELFCGYHRYWVMNKLNRFIAPMPTMLPRLAGSLIGLLGSDRFSDIAQAHPKLRLPAIKDRMRKFQAVLSHWQGDTSSAYPYALGYWLPHQINRLIGHYSDKRSPVSDMGNNLLESMMLWDMRHYLPDDILTKVDRATMYNSLEGRDPFLDHRIVEFALNLPISMKYKGGTMKYILKKLLGRYLPEHMFSRPKQGFAVPIYTWLHNDLMNMVNTYLNPDVLRAQNYIDPAIVDKTVNDFKSKNGSFSVDRIWLLLVFMMWKEKYL